jgi:hypothetical protein
MSDKGTDSKDSRAKKRSKSISIFSQEEVLSTIKGFILSWLQGNIAIQFPTAQEIVSMNKEAGAETSFEQARAQEFKSKKIFTDLILLCSGIEQTTLAEQEEASINLFNRILAYRCGNRIEGRFTKQDVNDRLSKLEESVEHIKSEISF